MKHTFLSYLLGLFFCALLLPACNPARQIEKGKLRKKSPAFLIKKLEQNRVEAEWFEGKAKLEFNGQGQRLKASTTIRMRKDSVIWMNVKKLGIEAARVQITPDSIYFLNRLTREYAIYDMAFLKRQFNLPLDFADLQELILGNAVMVEADGLEAKVEKIQHLLAGEQSGVNTTYVLNGLTYLLEGINVDSPREDWEVRIDQGEFGGEANYGNFPYFRNFNILSKDTGPIGLVLKFLKIDLNVPKKIQFEIPPRYTKMR